MDLRESLSKPVSEYASTDFVKVSFDDPVVKAATAMCGAGATEAVVMEQERLVGILTERDIVCKVVASGLDPSTTKVGAIMSAPVETVEDSTSVGEAIARMSGLGIRRLAVTRKSRFIGLVTQMSLASGKLEGRVSLPELAKPGSLRCPYCGEIEKNSGDLSKHIDRVHLGSGLLEGDLTKW
jgi:CBS domain-containing protein